MKLTKRAAYIAALKSYYNKTQGEIGRVTLNELADDIATIRGYPAFGERDDKAAAKFIMLFSRMLIVGSSALTSIVVLWSINEVFEIQIPFTFKNILIISLIFMISKIRVGVGKTVSMISRQRYF